MESFHIEWLFEGAPPIGGKSTDVDRFLVVGDLKAQRTGAQVENLPKFNLDTKTH